MIATFDDFGLGISDCELPHGEVTPLLAPAGVTSDSVAEIHPQSAIRNQQWFSAFTLIEVCIAMAVGMLIIGVAALSVTGLQDEDKLKESASVIESTARGALLKAISDHRPIALNIAGGIAGVSGNVEVKRYGEKVFRKADKDEVWEFDPTGVCEPIELRITSPEGTIELGFDPLTACARKKNVSLNHS